MSEEKKDNIFQKDAEYIKRDKKKSLLFLLFAFFFLVSLSLVPSFLERYFYRKAEKYFAQAKDVSSDTVFRARLNQAAGFYQQALKWKKNNFFPGLSFGEIYHKLGLCYLYQRDHIKAKAYFEKARAFFAKKNDFSSVKDLDFKIILSKVRVEGFLGPDQAVVNGHLVKAGDEISGITVLDISNDYVLFKYNDYVFSDSFDKYNPFAQKVWNRCERLLQQAQADKSGFSAYYYKTALDCARCVFLSVGLDAEQSKKLNAIIEESQRKLEEFELSLKKAKENKQPLLGMRQKDILEFFGQPIRIKKLYDMEFSECWFYDGLVLYFKDEPRLRIEGILSKIESSPPLN